MRMISLLKLWTYPLFKKHCFILLCYVYFFLNNFQSFAKEAREQCDVMQNMLKKMETLYTDLSEYYVFDKQKYTLEEFFTDLKTFKDSFLVNPIVS